MVYFCGMLQSSVEFESTVWLSTRHNLPVRVLGNHVRFGECGNGWD